MSLNFKDIDWVKVLTRAQLDVKYLSKRQGPCPLCGAKPASDSTTRMRPAPTSAITVVPAMATRSYAHSQA